MQLLQSLFFVNTFEMIFFPLLLKLPGLILPNKVI